MRGAIGVELRSAYLYLGAVLSPLFVAAIIAAAAKNVRRTILALAVGAEASLLAALVLRAVSSGAFVGASAASEADVRAKIALALTDGGLGFGGAAWVLGLLRTVQLHRRGWFVIILALATATPILDVAASAPQLLFSPRIADSLSRPGVFGFPPLEVLLLLTPLATLLYGMYGPDERAAARLSGEREAATWAWDFSRRMRERAREVPRGDRPDESPE